MTDKKRCSKCLQERDLLDFTKRGKNKRRAICKYCTRESNLEYNCSEKGKQRYRKYSLTEKRKECIRRTNKKRRSSPEFRIREALSKKINNALMGKKAGRSTEKLLGYSIKHDLVPSLLNKLPPGMGMKEFGSLWELDHKTPVSWFNIENEDDIKKCWAIDNLQPLLKITNCSKGNKFAGGNMIFSSNPREAAIFIGIPGSSKTTFYNYYFRDTHVRVNLSMLGSDRKKELKLIRTLYDIKQSFVLDDTNLTKEVRQNYINALRSNSTLMINAYYFVTNLEDCIQRNGIIFGEHKLSREVLEKMYVELEPPTRNEGFNGGYLVYPKQGPQVGQLVFTIERAF